MKRRTSWGVVGPELIHAGEGFPNNLKVVSRPGNELVLSVDHPSRANAAAFASRLGYGRVARVVTYR
jgi:hypothetical protein